MLAKQSMIIAAAWVALAASVHADWKPGDSYKMHFPQLPDPQGWDIEILTAQHEVADDWLCTETGPVSDIHFWYSTAHDQPVQIGTVTAVIYKDVPSVGPDPLLYSHPGAVLWRRTFAPNQFQVIDPYGTGLQGFADPQQANFVGWTPADHQTYKQINIVNIDNPFVQQAGSIYWLGLFVDWSGTQPPLGWKTSRERYQDLAVYRSLAGAWLPLISPSGAPLDMAFVITGIPEPAALSLVAMSAMALTMCRRRGD